MIRGSRSASSSRRRDSSPLDRKTRARIKFSQFLYISSCHIAIATRRKTRRSRDWPSHGCCNGGTRRTGILVANLERKRRARVDRANGNPTHRFFHIKGPGNYRASYPEVNASTLNPAAPSMDPASGQALALRRWTNWVLFCFLNTHRCSGSILYFFYFFIFFFPLSRSLSYVLHHPRKAVVYSSHVFIYHSFFFSFSLPLSLPMSRATIIDRFTVSQVVILTVALKHTYYYYITRPCAYMFSLYIYIHVYILLLLLPSRIYIYEHITTRAHTHYCYMCIRIYTHTTHILYNRVIC